MLLAYYGRGRKRRESHSGAITKGDGSVKKRMIVPTLLLFLLLMAGFFTVAATAADDSGYCGGEGDGTNLTWTLDNEGTLTISGSGAMKNYSTKFVKDRAPWSGWRDGHGVKTLKISNGVTSIGDYAFYDSNPTSVTIPNSVTSIGDRAFFQCSGLTSVTIPNGVTSIGDYAFQFCGALTNLDMPDGLISIGNHAFDNCQSLENVTIPASVTHIGKYAFHYGPKSVIISEGVTSIGEYAFESCKRLTSLIIPDSVTSIGDHAFAYCSGLTSVVIPNSATSLGNWAFAYCSNLTSVIIPDSATIGEGAFTNCKGLTNVTIGNGVTSIGHNAFENCDGLTSVIIPDSVTFIGDRAFEDCDGLTSVIIGNSVTSIGSNAFTFCRNLTSVTMGKKVTDIGYTAFWKCDNLTDIYYSGTQEQWNKISGRSYIPESTTIHYYDPIEVSLTFAEQSYTAEVGEEIALSATFVSDASPIDMKWSCNAPDAVTLTGSTSVAGPFPDMETTFYISHQMVGNKAGTYEITLTASGLTATTTLTITDDSSLTFDQQRYTAKLGETIALSATFLSSHGPTDMKWFCNDTEAVSLVAETSVAGPFPDMETTFYVSHQMVGNKAGTYEITLTASGLTATTTLVISDDEVSIGRDTYSLSIDETGVLSATSKSGATIHWSVSGNAVKETG